ncbi:class I SAM-dependent methyltransferase [Streptomyces sp. NPDC060198]|uniref:class I SAM-dependent methyltransferase n=1 Tax=Streptomyces sp. NPDC060198 TaxID=3347070 RepID=UPI003664F924
MFSDADAAALYDVVSPWDPGAWPADAFYEALVGNADSVLDVGCGTGAMLVRAREQGHTGRLVGLEPDRAALARARRRTDIEWIEGTAADADRGHVRGPGPQGGPSGFELVTMVSHAFQCLVTDDALRASLDAIHAALRPGGLFAFETRHPRARAWQSWTPEHASTVEDPSRRRLRVWHEVESAEDGVVAFTSTTASAGPDATVLRTDHARLRFLDEAPLDGFLAEAGFLVEGRYGDWDRTPVTATSREIITLARRPALSRR